MAGNRFKKNLDKEKTKEIVGNTTSVIVEEVNNIEDTVVTDTKNNEIEVEVETEGGTEGETDAKKGKTSNKSVIVKKLRDENAPSKPEIVKLGVTIKETVKSKVDALADDNNMKSNEVVNDLLGRLFDGKKFNVNIEKKDKTKVTSFNIPKEMDKAITKMSKATDVPKSEIFNRLLEEALEEFFK